jgi:hypothetical protein
LLRFGHIFMIFGEPGALQRNPNRHSIAVQDTLIKLLRHGCRGGTRFCHLLATLKYNKNHYH